MPDTSSLRLALAARRLALQTGLKVPTLLRRHLSSLAQLNIPCRSNMLYDTPPPSTSQLPPLASNPEAVSLSDPLSDFWRVDKDPVRVHTPIHVDKFILAHMEHCAKCKPALSKWACAPTSDSSVPDMLASLATDCYSQNLFHYLSYGYMPPFKDFPAPFQYDNYASIHRGGALARSAWDKQLGMDGVFRQYLPAHCVSPLLAAERFSVSTGTRKSRICFDASRSINDLLSKWPIRYEDLRQLLRLLRPDDWVSTIDLRSFYLILPLHARAQKFFQVHDPYSGRLLSHQRVPFGLATAPCFASAVSAELLRVIRHRFRCLGLPDRGSIYLDDYTFPAQSRADNSAMLRSAMATLRSLNVPISSDKVCTPTQQPGLLGVLVDTRRQTVQARAAHVAEALARLRKLQHFRRWKKKEVQRVAGLLQWLSVLVRGSQANLRGFWNEYVRFRELGSSWISPSSAARRDCVFWIEALSSLQSNANQVRWITPSTKLWITESDASGDVGCGIRDVLQEYSHRWSKSERELLSIPAKEFFPILHYARRFGSSILRDCFWLVATDSLTNTFVMNSGGSRAPELDRMFRELSAISRRHEFEFAALWQPREHNQRADDLSKCVSANSLLAPFSQVLRTCPTSPPAGFKRTR